MKRLGTQQSRVLTRTITPGEHWTDFMQGSGALRNDKTSPEALPSAERGDSAKDRGGEHKRQVMLKAEGLMTKILRLHLHILSHCRVK